MAADPVRGPITTIAHTISAVPNEANACRTAVPNEEASVMNHGGSFAIPQEFKGPIRPETPVARMPCMTKITQ